MSPLARYVIACLIAATLAGIGAWRVQEWRWKSNTQAKEIAQLKEQGEANAENRRLEQRRQSMVMEATNARNKREETLRRDAAGVRTELAGLRDDLAQSAGNLPGATCDAVRKRVTATENVFEQCAGRYSSLAETAGRHASDSLMLQHAWPK